MFRACEPSRVRSWSLDGHINYAVYTITAIISCNAKQLIYWDAFWVRGTVLMVTAGMGLSSFTQPL
jgi:hypothetical protein